MNAQNKLILLFSIIGCACALCFYPKTATARLSTFEKGAYCATANYTLFANGTVGVNNFARIGAVDGPINDITGYAEIPDAKEPGKLVVHLAGVPFGAPYWILALGDVVNNQYSWSVVSDEVCASLFVLSRTQAVSNETLTDIQTFLEGVGFDIKDDYVPITQGDTCQYSDDE